MFTGECGDRGSVLDLVSDLVKSNKKPSHKNKIKNLEDEEDKCAHDCVLSSAGTRRLNLNVVPFYCLALAVKDNENLMHCINLGGGGGVNVRF